MRQPYYKMPAPVFAWVARDYADTFYVRGPSTAADRSFIIRYFVDPKVNPWADKPIDQVTAADVDLLVEILKDFDERLARSGLTKLARLFHWALGAGRCERYRLKYDPTSLVPGLMADLRVKRQFLTLTEMGLYLNAVSCLVDWRERALSKALAHTGFPASDLARMRWPQLNFERGVWLHPRAKLRLPLSDSMIGVLIALRGNPGTDDFVFSIGGRPVDAATLGSLRARLAEQMEALGRETAPAQTIRDWTFTDIGRTVVLHLQEIGLEKDVAKIATGRKAPSLGHPRDRFLNHDQIRHAVNTHSQNLFRL